jgi:hypothetical protein
MRRHGVGKLSVEHCPYLHGLWVYKHIAWAEVVPEWYEGAFIIFSATVCVNELEEAVASDVARASHPGCECEVSLRVKVC